MNLFASLPFPKPKKVQGALEFSISKMRKARLDSSTKKYNQYLLNITISESDDNDGDVAINLTGYVSFDRLRS